MNFYNMNSVGKNDIERRKRIENQAAEAIRQKLNESKQEKEANEARQHKALMEGAQMSNAALIHRNKQKVRVLVESLEYQDKTSKMAMANYLESIVEKALPINEDEYAELNPNYKKEIRSLIEDFLNNGNINSNITVPETVKLMENISRTMPDVKTGIYLNEEEMKERMTPRDVSDEINTLSGNVSNKVAEIIADEQSQKKQLNQDMVDATNPETIEAAQAEQEPQLSKDEMIQQVLDQFKDHQIDMNTATQLLSQINSEDEDAEISNPESEQPTQEEMPEQTEEPIADEQEAQPEEVSQEEMPEEVVGVPEDDSAESVIQPQGNGTHIDIAPDGTVSINVLKESASKKFVKETPRTGLLESLAVNEAHKMLREGKPYNGELALANAISYITVLEAFNVSGLMNIDKNDYNKVVRLAGGRILNK